MESRVRWLARPCRGGVARSDPVDRSFPEGPRGSLGSLGGSRKLAVPGRPGRSFGGVAEWLGKGLQNPLHRFNSGLRLQTCPDSPVPCSPRALSSVGERFPDTEEVRGSNPLAPTQRLPCSCPMFPPRSSSTKDLHRSIWSTLAGVAQLLGHRRYFSNQPMMRSMRSTRRSGRPVRNITCDSPG
jgi:hypothetical protein